MAGGGTRIFGTGSGNCETNRFFKIILPSTIEDKKLGIPVMFVKKYGSNLSNVAVLTLPDGRIWRLGLTKADGKIWLENGWHELVEHYSILVGHFLIFKFKGENYFKVRIFDMTACEIQYPKNDTNRGEQTNNHGQCNGKMVIEEADIIEVDECTSQKGNGSSTKENATVPIGEGLLQNLPSEEVNIITGRRFYQTYSAASESSKRAIDLAKRLKPINPSFMVVMRSYNIHKSLLYVPMEFAGNYLGECYGTVTLLSPDGKRWPARMILSKNRTPLLSSGWGEFAREYLEEGDACIFELISPHTNTMNGSNVSVSPCRSKIQHKHPASVGTSNFKSINDSRSIKCKTIAQVPFTHDAKESNGGQPIKTVRSLNINAGGMEMGSHEFCDLNAGDTRGTGEFVLKVTIFRPFLVEKQTDGGN